MHKVSNMGLRCLPASMHRYWAELDSARQEGNVRPLWGGQAAVVQEANDSQSTCIHMTRNRWAAG